MTREDLINQRATTCRHGGHCEWVACDKCNHYEPKSETITNSTSGYLEVVLPKCDDCISRQAVLEGIAEWVAGGYADSEADISHISSLVTHLPSVTPKEKTGHWIDDGYKNEEDFIRGNKTYKCSCCGNIHYVKTDFCPNCGAKMVEPQESEDEDKDADI